MSQIPAAIGHKIAAWHLAFFVQKKEITKKEIQMKIKIGNN